MTRGLPSGFTGQLTSLDPKPLTLIEIETGDTPAFIRYTSQDSDHVWPTGGNTFTARPFETSDTAVDTRSLTPFSVTIGDVDEALDTWLLTTDFRHKKVKRYIIERDSVSATSHAVLDVFRITNTEQKDREFTFKAAPLADILSRVLLPAQRMTRENFPGIRAEGRGTF